jgi:DNA polymerase-3 subunit delta
MAGTSSPVPAADTPVVLVTGSDSVLVADAVRRAAEALLAGEDPGLALDDVGPDRIMAGSEPDLGALVDAINTPPFLTERRVVVGRGLGLFTKGEQVVTLVDALAQRMESNLVILAWDPPADSGGRRAGPPPKAIKEAVAAAGGITLETAPGRSAGAAVEAHLAQAAVSIDAQARRLVVEHLGEHAAGAVEIVDALVGAYGPDARLGVDEVTPYLLEAGGLKPWDLTDAIDEGRTDTAIAALTRMLDTGSHPLQLMAVLHTHVERMVALDGAGVADERAAAALLGMKGSTFPA